MSKHLSNAEQAKLILDAFEHYKARPGSVMRLQQLNSYMTGNHLHLTDINAGVDYCLAHHWVETQAGSGYRLTPVGYSRISNHTG